MTTARAGIAEENLRQRELTISLLTIRAIPRSNVLTRRKSNSIAPAARATTPRRALFNQQN
jgi:hypothetical protein